jgi:hypothetical protein
VLSVGGLLLKCRKSVVVATTLVVVCYTCLKHLVVVGWDVDHLGFL